MSPDERDSACNKAVEEFKSGPHYQFNNEALLRKMDASEKEFQNGWATVIDSIDKLMTNAESQNSDKNIDIRF